MSLKRSADDDYDSTPFSRLTESPRKRPKPESASFLPQTPVASSSNLSSRKGPFATPKTPFTPYPLQPSDSPSNPFGRKRAETLTLKLPPATSFSKHAALRFQLIRSDIPSRDEGVYRVVRVPMNYTFAHLRCLIAWLFNMPAPYSSGASGTSNEYLFEVKNKISMFSGKYRPGQIKSGSTFIKLSNVRDPARWRSAFGFEDDDEINDLIDELEEEMQEGKDAETGTATEDEDIDQDWKWADEEDLTLGHVFPRGIDKDIGIIYCHSATTQVHTTVNRGVTPRVKGFCNKPTVFTARGRAFLSPVPLPRPMFSKTIEDIMSSSPVRYTHPASKSKEKYATKKIYSSSPILCLHDVNLKTSKTLSSKEGTKASKEEELTDTDADGDADIDVNGIQEFNASHPFFRTEGSSPIKRVQDVDDQGAILVEDSDDGMSVEDSDDEEVSKEDLRISIDPNKWNRARQPFAHYLLKFMDVEGEYEDLDESFFEELKPYDPFEYDDDDDDDVVEVVPETEPIQDDEEEYEEDYEEITDFMRDGQRDDEEEEEKEEEEEEEEDNASETTSEQGERSEDEEDYEEEEEAEDEMQEHHTGSELYVNFGEEFGPDDEEQPTQISQLDVTPGLTNCTSSASSLPPSSPLRSSSPATLEFYFPNSSSYSLPDPADLGLIIDAHYPNKKYSKTPAPPKAKKFRLRIKRLEQRLAKIKKGSFLTKYDEDKLDQKESDKEVDELADDKDAGKPMISQSQVQIQDTEDGDDSNLFGDEAEI